MARIFARRGLVVLSGVALVAAGFAAPAAAQDGQGAGEICTTTTTGSTTWNIKESFNNYLEGFIANGPQYPHAGGVEVRDGIITSGEKASRTFEWPVDSANLNAGSISHTGGVHYTGHNHYYGDEPSEAPDHFILDNDFSNLTVEINGDTGRILVDYTSRAFIDTTIVGEFNSGTQAELASITFDAPVDLTAEGAVTATGTTVLTASGEAVFGGFYSAGTELSDIALNINNDIDCSPVDEGNDDGQPVSTGSSADGVLPIVALLAALGGIGAGLYNWALSTGLLAQY